MGTTDASGWQPETPLQVLTPAIIQQIDEKLAEAVRIGYAIVELEIQKGELRFIKGPAPSEPVRIQ